VGLAASSSSSHGEAAFEAAGDYFSTETHYQSIADRIVGALRAGGSFVVVTADPPANSQLLTQALRRSTASSHVVINLHGGLDLTPEEVRRAASVVTRLPANSGAEPSPEPQDPAPPLFIFDDFDQLSDCQIKELYDAWPKGHRPVTAGVLLAGPAFLSRMEEPALQFLRDGFAGTIRFRQIGKDESLDFLRYQLANRDRVAETHRHPWGISPAVIIAALLVLLVAGIGALFAPYFLEGDRYHSASSEPHRLIAREVSTPPRKPDAIPNSTPRATLQPTPLAEAVPPLAPAQRLTIPQGPSSAPTEAPAAGPGAQVPIIVAPVVEAAPPRVPPAPAQRPAAPSPGRAAAPVAGAVTHPPFAAPAAEAAPPRATPAPAPLPEGPSVALSVPGKSTATHPLSGVELSVLVARGDSFLTAGDIVSARLFYERAADAGDGPAALRLGVTFDPGFLARTGLRGLPGDLERAKSWYRRARDLGEVAAADRLKSLEEHLPSPLEAPTAGQGGASPGAAQMR